jgi:hypothetical protein
MSPSRCFQSSLRDEESLGALNRGLKATATFTKSLRDSNSSSEKMRVTTRHEHSVPSAFVRQTSLVV